MAIAMSSVGLKSADVDRAARFYVSVLGGEVTRRREKPDRRIWVRLGGTTLEIAEVSPWAFAGEGQRRQAPILAFQVGFADLDSIVAQLKSEKVPHHGPALKMAGESVGVYLSDPDGNGLSLSCSAGYPIAGLQRRDPNWAPEAYPWAG